MSLHLKKKFKVERGVRQCQRILKQLGVRLRKPRPVIANGDPVAQQALKKTSENDKRHQIYGSRMNAIFNNMEPGAGCGFLLKKRIRCCFMRLQERTLLRLVLFGFLFKVAFIDWYSRFLLGYVISNTLDSEFVIRAFMNAVKIYGLPLIVNSDQGSQFTSKAFVDLLLGYGILISMDGKGRALDNVMIERYWRSYKYECVYLNTITDGWHLKQLTDQYIQFYNFERVYQSLNYQTPSYRYGQGIVLSSNGI
jgi:transposase InsO family protein